MCNLDERWLTKGTHLFGQQKETGLQDFQDFRIDQSSELILFFAIGGQPSRLSRQTGFQPVSNISPRAIK
jgi:hypothetical protein